MFLARKEFVLPLERVVNVLEFLAFAFQTAVLLLEVSSLFFFFFSNLLC